MNSKQNAYLYWEINIFFICTQFAYEPFISTPILSIEYPVKKHVINNRLKF